MDLNYLEAHFSLFDRTSGTLIESLQYAQFRALLITIPKDRQINWLVCKEGDTNWSELADCAGIYMSSNLPELPPLPSDAQAVMFSRVHVEENTDVIELDQRLSRRFEKTVGVWIDYKGQIINNELVDISVTGARLKDPLEIPEGEMFWMILRVDPNPIQVMAKKAEMGVEEKQPRVSIMPNSNIDLLRHFLLRPDL